MSPRIARPLLSGTAEDDMPAAERKRLQKEAEAKAEAEENEKKQAEKALQAGKQEAAGAKEENVEELEDPTKYRENRMATVKAWKTPYPHKWPVDASIPGLIEKHKDMPAAAGQGGRGAARMQNQRNKGASVLFSDLWADGSKIQVVAQVQFHEVGDFKDERCEINRGDIIGARGSSGKSKKRGSYQKPPGRHRVRLSMGAMLVATSAVVAWARDRDVDDHRRLRPTLDRHLADLHLDAAVSFKEDSHQVLKGNRDWVKGEHLAQGGYGIIYEAELKSEAEPKSESFVMKLLRCLPGSSTPKAFVMKTPRTVDGQDSDELKQEIQTMKKIGTRIDPFCQKYVMLLEDFSDGPPPFYVAEKMAGSLNDFEIISETCLTAFVSELVEMLDCFHDKLKFVHFDIKADNILYTGTTSGLTLFGLLSPPKCPTGLRLTDFGGTKEADTLHDKVERKYFLQFDWLPEGVFQQRMDNVPASVVAPNDDGKFWMTKDIDLCGAALLLTETFPSSPNPVQEFADKLELKKTVDCGLMGGGMRSRSIKLMASDSN